MVTTNITSVLKLATAVVSVWENRCSNSKK